MVDRIEVDGNVFETESGEVYSTGTWTAVDGIVPGFRNLEVLHSNGYFQYDFDGSTVGDSNGVDPFQTEWVSNQISVNVAAQPSAWLPTINFEYGADGLSLDRGDIITDQFALLGVHVSTDDPYYHPAMILIRPIQRVTTTISVRRMQRSAVQVKATAVLMVTNSMTSRWATF